MRSLRPLLGAPWMTSSRPVMTSSALIPLYSRPLLHKPSSPNMTDLSGMYGWSVVDGVQIPHVLREGVKFVSVRMVELKYLSKYPSTYPTELKERAPLKSQYMSEGEAGLLSTINRRQCGYEYGHGDFTKHDLIVPLDDFLDFYDVVKRHYPDIATSMAAVSEPLRGGWVQVNNTVVPYVRRGPRRFVPLSVIRYGANLLRSVTVSGVECSDNEVTFLNQICKKASVDFTFIKTRLLELSEMAGLCGTQLVIVELPASNPMLYAQYHETDDVTKAGSLHRRPASSQVTALQTSHSPRPGHSTPSTSPSSSSSLSSSAGLVTSHHASTEATSSSGRPHDVIHLSGRHDVSDKNGAIKAALNRPSLRSTDDNSNLLQVSHNLDSRPRNRTHDASFGDSAKPRLQLQCTLLRGKGITSIRRGGRPFVLMESVNRMFFPNWSLDDFRAVLRNVGVAKDELSKEEEQAFIAHYELRISRLRTTHIVSLSEVEKKMTNLEVLYNERDNTRRVSNPSGSDVTSNNHVSDKVQAKSPEVETRNNKRPLSEMTAVSLPKRTKTSAPRHGTGKLEDIMSKLKKAQLNQVSATDTGNTDNRPSPMIT